MLHIYIVSCTIVGLGFGIDLPSKHFSHPIFSLHLSFVWYSLRNDRGGNYFMIGGSVKGGRIYGKYPDNLSPTSSLLNARRGLILPTTSWDSVWHSILQWLGVSHPSDMDYCLPNAANTESPVVGAGHFPLLTETDLFRT
jgi:hypothetical protein